MQFDTLVAAGYAIPSMYTGSLISRGKFGHEIHRHLTYWIFIAVHLEVLQRIFWAVNAYRQDVASICLVCQAWYEAAKSCSGLWNTFHVDTRRNIRPPQRSYAVTRLETVQLLLSRSRKLPLCITMTFPLESFETSNDDAVSAILEAIFGQLFRCRALRLVTTADCKSHLLGESRRFCAHWLSDEISTHFSLTAVESILEIFEITIPPYCCLGRVMGPNVWPPTAKHRFPHLRFLRVDIFTSFIPITVMDGVSTLILTNCVGAFQLESLLKNCPNLYFLRWNAQTFQDTLSMNVALGRLKELEIQNASGRVFSCLQTPVLEKLVVKSVAHRAHLRFRWIYEMMGSLQALEGLQVLDITQSRISSAELVLVINFSRGLRELHFRAGEFAQTRTSCLRKILDRIGHRPLYILHVVLDGQWSTTEFMVWKELWMVSDRHWWSDNVLHFRNAQYKRYRVVEDHGCCSSMPGSTRYFCCGGEWMDPLSLVTWFSNNSIDFGDSWNVTPALRSHQGIRYLNLQIMQNTSNLSGSK